MLLDCPPQPLDKDVILLSVADVHSDSEAVVFEDLGEAECILRGYLNIIILMYYQIHDTIFKPLFI